jgi:hypothetical protein
MKTEPTHITKDGFKAGIYSTDNGGRFPVHAWVECEEGKRYMRTLTSDLKEFINSDEPLLRPIPKKLEANVVLYWGKDGSVYSVLNNSSLAEAYFSKRKDIVAIKKSTLTAEEGEGL